MNTPIDGTRDNHLRSDDALLLLPSEWRATLAGRAVEPAAGMGGAAVFRVSEPGGGCQYLKLARGAEAAPLRREIARTEWLASHHVRVPQFLMKARTDDLTAVLMTAIPGRHLTPGTADLPALVRAIGRGLAQLHALPAADCPFDEMPRTRLARARDAIDRNQVDASEFDDRNAGITPEMLYQSLAGAVPSVEDVVIVHGDATLANMLVGPDGELGFIDCGNAGRSDRYLDLAVAEMELRAGFGPEAALDFVAAYGIQWDDGKAAFFRDLYELF
jgi:aminoglycoside 3'-phosphotransferase II